MSNSQRPTLIERTVQNPEILEQYTISADSYGKDGINLIYVKREGQLHTLKEFEVKTRLKLSTKKNYTHADNSDVVGTDAQNNMIFLLAKRYGIDNAEKFAGNVAEHIINSYSQVEEVRIEVEEYPWQRIVQEHNGETNGKSCSLIKNNQKHKHAFIFTPTEIHYCNVVIRRSDLKQTVVVGIKGLRVFKTAQSNFVSYVKDEYRETIDQYERLFSTSLDCSWEYSHTNSVKLGEDWNTVKNIFIQKFAGDPTVGTTIFSLQNLLYITGKEIFNVLPQVSVISMNAYNKHFSPFDTAPFQTIVPGENKEAYIANKPDSIIQFKMARKDIKSHLQ